MAAAASDAVEELAEGALKQSTREVLTAKRQAIREKQQWVLEIRGSFSPPLTCTDSCLAACAW